MSIIFIGESLQSAIAELLVVLPVQVTDLVHERVANLAPQLVVVVGGAGQVAAIQEDGRPRVRGRALRRRPEEAEDAG